MIHSSKRFLQQDIQGAEYLEKEYPTKRRPWWDPRVGGFRWEQYHGIYESTETVDAMFCRAPVGEVASSIAKLLPAKTWHAEVQDASLRLADLRDWGWLSTILVFRLKGEPWSMVSGLCHGDRDHHAFDEEILRFSRDVYRILGCPVSVVSENGSLDLRPGQDESLVAYNKHWEDEGAPPEWFEDRQIFVPAYRCEHLDDDLCFWLAEVSICDVERIDLFCSEGDIEVTR